jgi:hypothetical protein
VQASLNRRDLHRAHLICPMASCPPRVWRPRFVSSIEVFRFGFCGPVSDPSFSPCPAMFRAAMLLICCADTVCLSA